MSRLPIISKNYLINCINGKSTGLTYLINSNTHNVSSIKYLREDVFTAQTRSLSTQKKNFISGFFENIKEEFNKNKEMKESVKKFREEAKKLEESDALKEARKKYKALEDETDKSTRIIKEKLGTFTEKVKDSDFSKKAAEFGEDFARQAQKAAETVSKQTQELSQTAAFKIVSENVKTATKTIDQVTQISEIKPYKRPIKLRKRSELDEKLNNKVYESNTEATGMVLHKDSKWYQSWQNFKENNQYVNKMFEFKTQYDESDHPIVRATKGITEKFQSVFGGMFKSTEMSEVLTEIVKIDPDFELGSFLKNVQNDIIPNVLESLRLGEMEILKDWCSETAFNILTFPIKQCEQAKLKYNFEVYDISNVDISNTKLMEQGPVLIVTFNAQQTIFVTDAKGDVVEGDKEKLKRVFHVWALVRDQTVHDPNAAWRVMECAMHASEMFV